MYSFCHFDRTQHSGYNTGKYIHLTPKENTCVVKFASVIPEFYSLLESRKLLQAVKMLSLTKYLRSRKQSFKAIGKVFMFFGFIVTILGGSKQFVEGKASY